MNRREDLPEVARQAQAEHKQLHLRLANLRKLAAAADSPAIQQTHTRQLVSELQALRRQLSEHFDQEEKGGWLEEAACRLPRLSHTLTSLEHEHAKLLAQLDAILSGLGETVEAPRARESRSKIDSFIEDLLHHEQLEEQILQEGFNQDLEF